MAATTAFLASITLATRPPLLSNVPAEARIALPPASTPAPRRPGRSDRLASNPLNLTVRPSRKGEVLAMKRLGFLGSQTRDGSDIKAARKEYHRFFTETMDSPTSLHSGTSFPPHGCTSTYKRSTEKGIPAHNPDSTLASILLRPWPAALSTARFGCIDEGVQSTVNLVRRVYIKTANDRMVKLEQQDAMISRWPPSVVMVMDSDHSPFFSAPEHLLELILKSL
nr:unnamed protein product [Digitaria exilis]